MSVRSTTAQFNNLRGVATRPITLIRWEYSGALETISLSGDNIEFDGEIYTTAGVEMVSIDNNNSAVLSIVVDDDRMNQTLSGTWRGGKICQIYEIPALPTDDEYVYDAVDGILKIDGIIDNSQYSNGKITVNILHKYLVGKYTPRYRVNDFTSNIPSAGSFVAIGTSRYQLKGRRQRTTERIKPKALRGRLSTQEINSFALDDKALDVEVTADGAFMPVIIGRNPVPGMICASGRDTSSPQRYVYVVAWGIGPIFEIQAIYNNNAALPSTAIVHHYRGIKCQGVDNYAATITGITYADDWRILTPSGYACGAYSVIVLPSSTTETPRFQAVINGVLGYDPREDGAGGNGYSGNGFEADPFNQGENLAVGYDLRFIGTNGTSPTTGMDWSSYTHTITYAGNAQIQSNKLSLDGTGDYVTVPSNTNTRFGSGKWTLELTVTPTVAGEINDIFGVGDATNDRCIQISQLATALYVNMSGNGTSWNIAATVNIYNTAFSANATTYIVIEYDELGYHFYVNGTHRYYIASTTDLYASTATIQVGRHSTSASGAEFKGSITGVRFTKGYNRYGGVHTTTTADTYCDSNSHESGYIYTDTAAANFAAIVKSPYYGLGVTEDITNLLNMFKHNEATIGTQTVEHTLDIVIADSRPTVEWIDQICGTYGETFWFPEGDTIAVRPDRIADSYNPSGWELTTNGDFITDASDWTLGTGWSHIGTTDGVISAATNTTISQTLGKPTVAGDVYIVTLSLDAWFGGSLRIDLDGITVIEAKATSGVYTYEFVADGTESLIEGVCSASTTVIVGEISLRRKYWRDESIVAGSLQITPLRNSDAPNRLIASYRKIASGTANWGDDVPITVEMPGAGIDGTPVLDTRIRFDGLRSTSKTTVKAKTKLYRLQGKDTVSWKTTDIGLLYQKGMVIELYDAEFDLLVYVLLESVERVESGRYQCRGTRYSDNHYPDNQTNQAGTIPVGLIMPLLGDTVPSGWQAYDTSPSLIGRYIKCAGESLALHTRGGATTHAAITGDTSENGAHGTDGETFPVKSYTGTSGSGSGRRYTAFATEAGAHDHTYTTGTITPDLYRAEIQLVKKITSTATTLPDSVMAFGQADLEYQDMHRYTALGKRLLKAAAAWATGGVYQQLIPITTGSTDDTHDHETYSNVTNGSPSGTAVTDTHYAADTGGGAHTHQMILELIRNIGVHRLCLYASGETYGMGQGMIGFWDGTLASLHQDYTLCDGRLGTPFIEGKYIEIAAAGDEDVRIGNNTLSIEGTTRWSAKHEHQGTADTADTYAVVEISHSDEVRHRHTVRNPDWSYETGVAYTSHHDWEPPYHALYPVMYNPNPVAGQRDVILLIDGDKPNGNTTISDLSMGFRTATIAGSGTMEYDSAQQLFSLNTVYCTGKRATYSSMPFGKKWSIQGFFRNDATGIMYLFSNYNAGAGASSFSVVKNASGNIELYTATTLRATVTLSLTSGAWFYVALCYDYAEFRLYAGTVSSGVATRATYTAASITTTTELTVADIHTALTGIFPFTGNYAQFRVIAGAAIHSGANVAIPTEPFQTWHESRHFSGAYNWWNECGITEDGYYSNLAPDLDQAILPWNPGGRASLFQEVGTSSYTISAVWPGVHNGGEIGLMVLVTPSASEFALGFNYESALGLWVLWELGREPTDIAALAVAAITHTDGDSVTLSVEVSGSNITCKVDGVTVITNTGSPTFSIPAALLGSTKAGVFIDVNRVEGRPANVQGLVAPYTLTRV